MVEVPWWEQVWCDVCVARARWRDEVDGLWCDVHVDPARRSQRHTEPHPDPHVEGQLFPWAEEWPT